MKKLFKVAQEMSDKYSGHTETAALRKAAETMKALYITHLHNHWESQGQPFYSDHLMYQRLYEAASADLDLIMERIIGVTGVDTVKLSPELVNEFAGLLTTFAQIADPLERALTAEKACKQALSDAYEQIKSGGDNADMMGWEDLLPQLATNRETALYLLGQRSK